jgi:predicted Rossmann fold nucleotide-binding protein DprA/Smf involved in DNA uptake
MSNPLKLVPADYCGSTTLNAGNRCILNARKLAFVCSVRCAASVILKVYDFTRLIGKDDLALLGGFHSPIEKDCLEFLLRGSSAVIVCPARRLSSSRLPREWRKAIETGRMLLLSPFDDKQKRATAELAAERNRFVAGIADEVLIAYAHPGSKTETLFREVLATGKRVYTFNDPANEHLISMGAVPIEPDHFSPSTASNSAAGETDKRRGKTE